nr:hypothetical protein CFP56_14635 [Quercus suber]
MLLLVLGIFCRLFALHKYALCLFISLQVLMELTGTIVLKLVFLWFKYLKKFHAFNHNRPCMFVASFFYCLMIESPAHADCLTHFTVLAKTYGEIQILIYISSPTPFCGTITFCFGTLRLVMGGSI